MTCPIARRLGIVVGGTALLGLVAALAPGAANAQAPTKAAWFNAASGGGVALPFPTTAPGDLHVGQGAHGPTAYAAVAYDLSGFAVQSASLTLKITPHTTIGTIDLVACPTKTEDWKAGGNQPLGRAPAYDCTSPSAGLLSANGASITFLLDAPARPSGYSLAIVPTSGAAPFQADLTKPDASSLTPAQPPTAGDSGGTTTTAPGSGADPGTAGNFGTMGTAASGPGSAGSDPAGAVPLSSGMLAAPPVTSGTGSMPAPEVAGAAGAGATQGGPGSLPAAVAGSPAAASAAFPPISNRPRYLAGSLLALLAGAAVWAYQQQSPQPRVIGGLARRAAPGAPPLSPGASAAASRPRGIGRFASARTAPARRLV